jgi:hypothetical protein
LALPSDGARQSPRGESDPPAATFGPFGHGGALELAEAEEARLFGRYFLFLRGSLRRVREGRPGGARCR